MYVCMYVCMFNAVCMLVLLLLHLYISVYINIYTCIYRYQEQLKAHILSNPGFITPIEKQNEILKRLEEPLQDLCISRASITWGIQVPDDDKHVMYVWFDALTNYYSGI